MHSLLSVKHHNVDTAQCFFSCHMWHFFVICFYLVDDVHMFSLSTNLNSVTEMIFSSLARSSCPLILSRGSVTSQVENLGKILTRSFWNHGKIFDIILARSLVRSCKILGKILQEAAGAWMIFQESFSWWGEKFNWIFIKM